MGLPDGVRAVSVAAGYVHSLVVGDDGLAYGTGWNFYGQLTGTGGRRTLTVLTGLPVGVRAVAAAAALTRWCSETTAWSTAPAPMKSGRSPAPTIASGR